VKSDGLDIRSDGQEDDSRIWSEAIVSSTGLLLSHHGGWSFLPTAEQDDWSPELYKIL
jgi:hypothetical protein